MLLYSHSRIKMDAEGFLGSSNPEVVSDRGEQLSILGKGV